MKGAQLSCRSSRGSALSSGAPPSAAGAFTVGSGSLDWRWQNLFNTSTPLLTWTALSAAQGYQVQVASDKLFTKVVYTNDQIAGDASSLSVSALPTGTYYYRVRAKLASGWGAWSAVTPLVVSS